MELKCAACILDLAHGEASGSAGDAVTIVNGTALCERHAAATQPPITLEGDLGV